MLAKDLQVLYQNAHCLAESNHLITENKNNLALYHRYSKRAISFPLFIADGCQGSDMANNWRQMSIFADTLALQRQYLKVQVYIWQKKVFDCFRLFTTFSQAEHKPRMRIFRKFLIRCWVIVRWEPRHSPDYATCRTWASCGQLPNFQASKRLFEEIVKRKRRLRSHMLPYSLSKASYQVNKNHD